MPCPGAAAPNCGLLVSAGSLLLVDGEYASTSTSLGTADPVQCCISAALDILVHAPWQIRQAPGQVSAAGFVKLVATSHNYLTIGESPWFQSIIDRGADAMAASGLIDAALASALKQELRTRIESGRFYGQVPFVCITAQKPGL